MGHGKKKKKHACKEGEMTGRDSSEDSHEPMRTFHERSDNDSVVPFRLSYHGGSHYNAVLPIRWKREDIFVKERPGALEDYRIEKS